MSHLITFDYFSIARREAHLIQTKEPIKNNAQNFRTYCQMIGACLDVEKTQDQQLRYCASILVSNTKNNILHRHWMCVISKFLY